MDSSEIQLYKNQLMEIDLALENDPNNQELISLKAEIQELLDLTSMIKSSESLHDSLEPAPSNSKTSQQVKDSSGNVLNTNTLESNRFNPANPNKLASIQSTYSSDETTHKWKIGDDCSAKYFQDDRYYPAKIVELLDGNLLKVTFVGYGNTETVSLEDIQQLKHPKHKDSKTHQVLGKRSSNGVEDNEDSASYPIKNEKKHIQKTVAKQAVSSQKSWLEFNKKNKKRKVPAINKNSIFKSPDTIDGKVGVSGSGRRMTQFTERIKHR
ncbi:hypothetical protein BB560_003461 [Smittium megazygosporum]|uniref:Tudor domain-containing protein n=1 Tax=Smittium megazygosporum TaxID=133381 RepID=A0A2T9ZBZ4_9FUNG|nr:hypothetical protein BB560_003461 [Smittium megazygosporum]